MFDAAAKKYCQIMEPGILDENCEVIGKITAKATLWDKKHHCSIENILLVSFKRCINLIFGINLFTVCKEYNRLEKCGKRGQCRNVMGMPACSCTNEFSGDFCDKRKGTKSLIIINCTQVELLQ